MSSNRISDAHIINALLVALSCCIASFIFYTLSSALNTISTAKDILSYVLTVNGVFSAILITYLTSRLMWDKDRKLDLRDEAIKLSQKVTDFRRIANNLTGYYGRWENDVQTKSLLDSGRYKNIDFFDFRMKLISDYQPPNATLIDELFHHNNYSEGISTLYLAMVSLLRDRRRNEYTYQEELYKDFEYRGIYDSSFIERWIQSNIMGTISIRLKQNPNFISFHNMSQADRNYISEAAARINPKYRDHAVAGNLIVELADDMENYYLPELYKSLSRLKIGVEGLNLTLIILISMSLIFGVLIPFILLFSLTNTNSSYIIVALTASINIALITFFTVKFPFVVHNELQS